MTPWALAAKSIKAELRKAHPGIKFEVRSKSYSGGSRVYIDWDLGPTTDQVKAISDKYQAGKYQAGNFDCMIDLYEYDYDKDREAFRREHGKAKYILEQRRIPDYVYPIIIKALCKAQHEPWEHGSAKYILEQRRIPDYVYPIIIKALCKAQHEPYDRNIRLMNEWASTWVYRIMRKASLPPEAVVTGLKRTDCTCGRWEDFFEVEYEVKP